jgi:hypothetical protein
MSESLVLKSRPWAVSAAVLGFAMTAAYVALFSIEGGNHFWDIFPWALLMTTAAVIAFSSVLETDVRVARNLLIGAAILYVVIGLVSVFSIGSGFLLAMAVALIGANKFPPQNSS